MTLTMIFSLLSQKLGSFSASKVVSPAILIPTSNKIADGIVELASVASLPKASDVYSSSAGFSWNVSKIYTV